MRNRSSAVRPLLGVALLCFAALSRGEPAPSNAAAAARGKYLVTIMSCNDCHTPFKMGANGPEPDMTRLLSGHPESMKLPPAPAPVGPWIWSGSASDTAFSGPWGVTYSMNLTPDRNTGIGIWTEEMFIRTMRTGKHMATSRPIQPPMPWNWIRQATDADLKAIFAYLKSIPPIVNHVPDYEPPKSAAAAPPLAKPASANPASAKPPSAKKAS